ncbi:MAG TPA: hypothetical protein VK659_10280 [Asanoa sp.]|nr:hypothetical protein [Asanoa sp.]
MTEMTRAQQTARVLALLDESFQARARGDRAEFDRLAQEAVRLDVDCVSVIQGGIVIGEIPNPETDYAGWSDYVATAQEQAEQEGGATA